MSNYSFPILTASSLFFSTSIAFSATDIQISAPIFPRVDVMYQFEGEQYPTTDDEKRELVDKAFLNYEILFQLCVQDDTFKSRINVATDGQTLTQEQLASNYNTIADCAYEKFTSKPYFIPQLVEDVDMCARLLPANEGWRMITDTDINSWNDEVFTQLSETLNAAWPNGGDSWGSFYFSTATYIKTESGLRIGALYPAISSDERIVDLPDSFSDCSRKCHREAVQLMVGDVNGNKHLDLVPITLRCIKTNTVSN